VVAHVITDGLGPLMIDMMPAGFVSAIATNGAAVIHDVEIALAGATSEGSRIAWSTAGSGCPDETGRLLNGAINDGVRDGGIGQAVGRFLNASGRRAVRQVSVPGPPAAK